MQEVQELAPWHLTAEALARIYPQFIHKNKFQQKFYPNPLTILLKSEKLLEGQKEVREMLKQHSTAQHSTVKANCAFFEAGFLYKFNSTIRLQHQSVYG